MNVSVLGEEEEEEPSFCSLRRRWSDAEIMKA